MPPASPNSATKRPSRPLTPLVIVNDFVFNVAAFVREPPGTSRSYDVLAPPEALNVAELATSVAGRVRLVRLSGAIHASGEFEASVEQPCARCLEPARQTLRFEADGEFLIDPDGAATEESGLEAVWPLDDQHNLDLTPFLAEGLIAALPLMPVCRPECPGLERSEEPAEAAIDPRWSRLAELRATMFPDMPGTKG